MSIDFNYDKFYYDSYDIENPYDKKDIWQPFFNDIADRIVKYIDPKTVLDAGCAMGYLVEALRDRGVEAYGIDISEYAISKVRKDIKPYCSVGSILNPLNRNYDLIISIEVIEHLNMNNHIKAIENLCNYTNDFLFSSTPTGYNDPSHFNIHPTYYWAKVFANNKFIRDVDFDASFISEWAIRFRKNEENLSFLISQYERIYYMNYIEKKSLRNELIKNKNMLSERFYEDKRNNFEKIIEDKDHEINDLNKAILCEKTNVNKYLKESLGLMKKVKDLEQYETNYFDAIKHQSEINMQLTSIMNSRGYRFLQKYYKLRVFLIPPNSRRIKMAKMLFKLTKITNPIYFKKGLTYIKANGIKSTLYKIYSGNVPPSVQEKDAYSIWISRNEPSKEELVIQRQAKFKLNPLISIVVPTYNTPINFLIDMIESVENQTYSNWELCIADGGSENIKDIKKILNKHKKIVYKVLQTNEGIAGNSNEALSLANGEYVALLDHDDILPPFALYEVIKAINENPQCDFIYSDEDKFEKVNDKRFDPHFKPDFSPDTLMSYNYITHLSVIKTELIKKIEGFRDGYNGSQDYDLILRATENANCIIHIPKVLYHWRIHENSVSLNPQSKIYAYESAINALNSHLERNKIIADVEHGAFLGSYKINYKIINNPKVSIIIPNKDHVADLKRCLFSIRTFTTYSNYEIIIVENNSELEETFQYYEGLRELKDIKILNYEGTFNFSKINNFASTQCDGDYLLFLNNDTEVITKRWIEMMLEHCQRDDVGIVGAKLYYKDNTIQHAGVILNIAGLAGHSHKYCSRNSFGYFGRASIIQNLSAVSGACMMIKHNIFNEVNGLDEDFEVAYNDIDLCLKVRKMGKLIVWTPYAELYHFESKTRGFDNDSEIKMERLKAEANLFKQKWKAELEKGDQYYNTNFTLDREDFSLKI